MLTLIFGIIIFFGMHLLPSLNAKNTLIERLGPLRYKGVFSIISIIGLGLIIYGKSQAEFVAVWNPPVFTRWIPIILMWPSLVLLTWADFPGNIKNRLRHPMLFGVTLFSFAHLCANGDLASIVLFGSFGLFAILDIIAVNQRAQSTAVTGGKVTVKKSVIWDWAGLIIGTIIYGLILNFHGELLGVAVI